MPTVFPSLHAVDQDSPHFSEMDIETLHNQLLEAAAALDDFAVRSSELVDMWARGFHSGRYIDIPGFDKRHPVIAPEGEADTICIPITLFSDNVPLGVSLNDMSRLTFKPDTSISLRVDSRANWEEVSHDGDVDFAFVRPQAVEYKPVIPADYTTAIPSIYSQMEKDLNAIMQDDGSEDPLDTVVSSPIHGSSPALSTRQTRQIASLSPRVSSLAFSPYTPPLRLVDRNVDEDHKRASRKRKVQAPHYCVPKKAKEAILTSPSPNGSKGRTRASAQAIGQFVCPEAGCHKVCKRFGDLNRHRQSRAHQLPSFPCPSGCGNTFTRKDAAKRHSQTNKCAIFRLRK